MTERLDGARVLIYSHDSFGLGHLRRCRAIAHSLVDQYKGVSVLILSGSPIIGSFDFRARVDFVRIPGVIKLYNGDYTSLGLHIDLKETLAMRASIIRHTGEIFAPDLFLVDKEPLGLKDEVKSTLQRLRAKGTATVLGLRDVIDSPTLLSSEWKRKRVIPALDRLYDEIWVYGLREFSCPFEGMEIPPSVHNKIAYTGYLPRAVPQAAALNTKAPPSEPYLLVTAGGGGDGAEMMDWVLRAYECDSSLPFAALLVLGPFMPAATKQAFLERVTELDRVTAIEFDSHIERLMERASAIVAMGGYNTFCEIISLDKRALLIPRTHPRREQLVRATTAQNFGLVEVLRSDTRRDTNTMIEALHKLPHQKLPSEAAIPGLLNGLEKVNELAERHIVRSNLQVPLKRSVE